MFPLVRFETGLIYIQHGFFDWVDNPWGTRRPELLQSAVDYWFEHYPIGYTDVAKQFGVRPATLFQKIRRTVAKLPEQLRPKRILFWDVKPETSLGTFRMAIENLQVVKRSLKAQKRSRHFS